MKENNEKIERDLAEEREEIYALDIIDYLTFLYTPPLSEVGMQVPRSILSSWYIRVSREYFKREDFNWLMHT